MLNILKNKEKEGYLIMKLTVDVENTVTHRGGKIHLDPFESTNKLVMVGCLTGTGKEYLFRDTFDGVQELLDEATILIGHNIVHDLMWLWECGFNYKGPVFDTMLGEYILQRGDKKPLSLEACAERYELETQKQDTLKEYFKQGVGVDEIPADELSSYLSADLHATQQLSDVIYRKLNTVEYASLMPTVILTNKVAVTLGRIYQRGFKVDKEKLEEVRVQFEKEKQGIEERLNKQVRNLMGDTPINLNSPEQMSWVIYSKKPIDKAMWANNFFPYMSNDEYRKKAIIYSHTIYKTQAVKCNDCNGEGYIRKVKKDGNLYSKPSRCIHCNTSGYLFNNTDAIGGLKFTAPTSKWISANGFTTNKTYLDILRNTAKKNDLTDAVNFLTDLQRLSALDTYLSSFVEGISNHVKSDGMLHVRLLQHRTATGRFSGADPNMQNMPRCRSTDFSPRCESTHVCTVVWSNRVWKNKTRS